MRKILLGLVLGVPLVLAGCGDQTDDRPGSATSPTCPEPAAHGKAVEVLRADLDGDGTADRISSVPATSSCRAAVIASVGGHEGSVPLDDALPIPSGSSFAITVPGRQGELAVVRQEHPRGGFQVHLIGYADGKLGELTVDGRPVLPFVATDAMTTPLAAGCVADGFEVTDARAHQPIGVMPAWDVYRTTYRVDGTEVTRGETAEVADNVLDPQLRSGYRKLMHYSLFQNCRATS
jgi:hypothetical protein